MKKLLIGFNCALALGVCALIYGNLSAATAPKKSATAHPHKNVRKKSDKTGKNTNDRQTPQQLVGLDSAVDKVVVADVFNNVRSPFANIRTSRNDLVLVGVFQSGNVSGAIIKQNTRNHQVNPYLMQAMRMSGGNNRAGGQRFTRWSMMSGRGNEPQKQYVRLGETMSNGYTLAEVTRQHAVLVRGNDKLELELQDPSKNRSTQQRRPRMNSTQQYQQAQLYLQAEMIRAFRQGNSGNRNQAPANRGRR